MMGGEVGEIWEEMKAEKPWSEYIYYMKRFSMKEKEGKIELKNKQSKQASKQKKS